jgi:UDP-glucose:(heptosyl)LPS alpha-1,3-glucosyltransferase
MDIAFVFRGCHRKGGVERSVWELARNLVPRHTVSVYAHEIESEGLDEVHLVPIEFRGPSTMKPWLFARAARHALTNTHHDHVIAFGVGDVKADVLWVNSVHRVWMRQSITVDGSSGLRRIPGLRYLSPRHQLLLWMERQHFTRNHATAIVTVADAVSADLVRLYGIAGDVTTTIHNGYSPSEFSPQRRRALRQSARTQLGYRDDDVVALIAANELARKGFDVLLEAQALVANPHLHVLLVGRAPMTPATTQRLRQLGLADRVRYEGSQSDMGRVHAAADLFVLPTQYEAFALAIVEALASGLPVITTRTPGAEDRITDRQNGRLLDNPRSAEELSQLLGESMEPDVRARWAGNAAASVADLTWSALAVQTEQLLESLPTRDRPRQQA